MEILGGWRCPPRPRLKQVEKMASSLTSNDAGARDISTAGRLELLRALPQHSRRQTLPQRCRFGGIAAAPQAKS
jgi:hypothetical protein